MVPEREFMGRKKAKLWTYLIFGTVLVLGVLAANFKERRPGSRRLQSQWLPSRLIPHRHRPRAELQPAHELQVDTLR